MGEAKMWRPSRSARELARCVGVAALLLVVTCITH